MKYPLVIGNFQQWNPICTLFKSKSVYVATELWYYTYIYKVSLNLLAKEEFVKLIFFYENLTLWFN